jgi:xanthine/CO dehydrogenase XdhC/CoxF family maturation factor
MKEIREIVRLYELHRGEPLALATLVAARGSSYRRPGARMLICADGTAAGSLSGGCLEEEVVRRTRDVLRDGTPISMNFDTRLRFGCNGSIDVFVEPARQDFLIQLATNFSERRSCRAITVFASGDLGTRIVAHDSAAPVGAFVQEIEPAIRLLIFGEGPDSPPLRAFAEILGWEVFEIDRPADLARYADSRSAAIVKSHNYGRDFAALCQLLKLDLRQADP